ncbi:hypothetical protein [Thermosporothrix hazakensis]|jgi:hypothetical protein|uniref:hypothetical protein n=1 Tax=Thermosporothrix hazakensis TaxID=644383 RepID=UPI000DAC30E4|nr:hypothetical protein [Thermosporothrix hazakensis]
MKPSLIRLDDERTILLHTMLIQADNSQANHLCSHSHGQSEPQKGDLAVKGAQLFSDLLAGSIARSIQRQNRVSKRGSRIGSQLRQGLVSSKIAAELPPPCKATIRAREALEGFA